MPVPSSDDLSDPGIEPVCPTIASGFFTTGPPGKPHLQSNPDCNLKKGESFKKKKKKKGGEEMQFYDFVFLIFSLMMGIVFIKYQAIGK